MLYKYTQGYKKTRWLKQGSQFRCNIASLSLPDIESYLIKNLDFKKKNIGSYGRSADNLPQPHQLEKKFTGNRLTRMNMKNLIPNFYIFKKSKFDNCCGQYRFLSIKKKGDNVESKNGQMPEKSNKLPYKSGGRLIKKKNLINRRTRPITRDQLLRFALQSAKQNDPDCATNLKLKRLIIGLIKKKIVSKKSLAKGKGELLKNENLEIFQNFKIRRIYDEKTEAWFFSVVDVIAALTTKKYQTARKYWKVLKYRLKKEGNQTITNIEQMKLQAANGKKYLTDVANVETLVDLINFIPSRNVKPIKIWLAKVGYERIEDIVQSGEKISPRAVITRASVKKRKENKKKGKVLDKK